MNINWGSWVSDVKQLAQPTELVSGRDGLGPGSFCQALQPLSFLLCHAAPPPPKVRGTKGRGNVYKARVSVSQILNSWILSLGLSQEVRSSSVPLFFKTYTHTPRMIRPLTFLPALLALPLQLSHFCFFHRLHPLDLLFRAHLLQVCSPSIEGHPL